MALTPFFLLLLTGAMEAEPAHPGYADADPTCGVVVEEAAPQPVPVAERLEEFDGGRIVDISHYYREEMPVWESADGTGGFLRLVRSMRNSSDIANFSELRLTAHSGTHVDAPGHVFEHYYDAGFDVDTLDLAVLNGPALLVDVPRDKNITANVMESLHIPKGVRRVLFRTLNTDRKLMWKKEFDTSYVGFMKDGAQWLIDNTDIRLVGVDYLSVGAFDECIPAHLVFLEKRVPSKEKVEQGYKSKLINRTPIECHKQSRTHAASVPIGTYSPSRKMEWQRFNERPKAAAAVAGKPRLVAARTGRRALG